MNTTSWPKVRRILEAAIHCPPHRRERLLDRACRGDADLRRDVCELLSQELPADDWLESPVPDVATNLLELSQFIGTSGFVGRYRIGDVIAFGGMGVVLRGIDESSDVPRPVAIKVIQKGLYSRRTLRAFRREQQLLEQLDHPNITRLIDSGMTPNGLPYIVMEFVDGQPIDEFMTHSGMTLHERLNLFRAVCLAVHYAHQNLVVHRDLKPANILVSNGGVVKLLDFGIAKLLHDGAAPTTASTETVMNAMTLQYSSPEQIRGEPITTATDVYALGVILYELLAGRPPYNLTSASLYEAEKIICDAAPPSPREALRSDATSSSLKWSSALDRIVMMAMNKDARRRYASAEQFAQDIQRYLEGSTVLAYRPGRVERALSTIRKHRGAFGVAAASFMIVISLALVLAFTARAATNSRDREMKARQVSEKINGFLNGLLAASGPPRVGSSLSGLHVLAEASALAGRELADQPDVAAGIHMQIGSTYYNLRRDEDAIQSYRRALACYRKCDQTENAHLADCLASLGGVLSYRDDEEGLALQREALALRRGLYGDDDLRVADSLHSLAFALTRCARPPRYVEAEGLYQKALEMRRRLGAEESSEVAETLHAVAALKRHQDHLQEAADQYSLALALGRRVLNPLDSQFIDCLDDYAVCLRELGLFDQAEALLEESLKLTAQSLGDCSAACTLSTLASLKQAQGGRAASWRLIHHALARISRVAAAGQTGSVEDRWRKLVEQFERQPAEPQSAAYDEFIQLAPVSISACQIPPDVYCFVLDSLAGLANKEGDFDLGARLAQEICRTGNKTGPCSDLTVARFRLTLADALIGLKRLDEARSLLTDSYREFCDRRGSDYRETRAIRTRLDGLRAVPN